MTTTPGYHGPQESGRPGYRRGAYGLVPVSGQADGQSADLPAGPPEPGIPTMQAPVGAPPWGPATPTAARTTSAYAVDGPYAAFSAAHPPPSPYGAHLAHSAAPPTRLIPVSAPHQAGPMTLPEAASAPLAGQLPGPPAVRALQRRPWSRWDFATPAASILALLIWIIDTLSVLWYADLLNNIRLTSAVTFLILAIKGPLVLLLLGLIQALRRRATGAFTAVLLLMFLGLLLEPIYSRTADNPLPPALHIILMGSFIAAYAAAAIISLRANAQYPERCPWSITVAVGVALLHLSLFMNFLPTEALVTATSVMSGNEHPRAGLWVWYSRLFEFGGFSISVGVLEFLVATALGCTAIYLLRTRRARRTAVTLTVLLCMIPLGHNLLLLTVGLSPHVQASDLRWAWTSTLLGSGLSLAGALAPLHRSAKDWFNPALPIPPAGWQRVV